MSLEYDLQKKKSEEEVKKEGSDKLFRMNLVDNFEGLSNRQNKEAKIKILQVFLDLDE